MTMKLRAKQGKTREIKPQILLCIGVGLLARKVRRAGSSADEAAANLADIQCAINITMRNANVATKVIAEL